MSHLCEENDVKIRTHKNARYATIDDVGKKLNSKHFS